MGKFISVDIFLIFFIDKNLQYSTFIIDYYKNIYLHTLSKSKRPLIKCLQNTIWYKLIILTYNLERTSNSTVDIFSPKNDYTEVFGIMSLRSINW